VVLDQALDRVTDGFVVLDRTWRFVYVNRSGANILGRPAEQLIGQVVWELFPEAVGHDFHRAQERALATQEPVFLEAYYAAWDRWFENRIYPSGLGLSIFFSDISERKRAEVERERLHENATRARGEAEAALARLHAIQSVTDTALAHLDLDDLLGELLARLCHVLGADRAALALIDEESGALFTRAAFGFPLELVRAVRVPLGRGVTGRIAAEGVPLIVDDYSSIDLSGVEGLPPRGVLPATRSVAGAPLHVASRVIGVVTVASQGPHTFTEGDLEVLQLVAGRVAPAIDRRRLFESAQAAQDRLSALSSRLIRAQEDERRRLARELHDELGQVLTAVKINLESLSRGFAAGPVSARLRDAIDSVDQASQTVRDLALDLRPSVLDDLGLLAALRWYLDRFARDTRVEAHLSMDAVPSLEPELETTCFRVAQEALTNVARHARATQVWLELHLVAHGIELKILDDGIGFDVHAARARAVGGASMGLLGMEERVSLAGGAFHIHALSGHGTEVRARFRLDRRSDHIAAGATPRPSTG